MWMRKGNKDYFYRCYRKDGKVLKELRRRKGQSPVALKLDVRGVDRLVLESVAGESPISDFCDWAEARVFNEQDSAARGK